MLPGRQMEFQSGDLHSLIAPLMLPFAANRVLSLVRCPQGRARKCFFQKHDSGSFGPHVHSIAVREKDGGTEDYLHIADADGLLACAYVDALQQALEAKGWAMVQPVQGGASSAGAGTCGAARVGGCRPGVSVRRVPVSQS